MVPQHLKHLAISRPPAAAFVNHAFQFRAQRLQAGHALLHLFELATRDGISLITGPVGMVAEVEQLADRIERETELSRMADEGQPVELCIVVAPLPAFGPARFGHEPNLFVVPDGLHLRASLL